MHLQSFDSQYPYLSKDSHHLYSMLDYTGDRKSCDNQQLLVSPNFSTKNKSNRLQPQFYNNRTPKVQQSVEENERTHNREGSLGAYIKPLKSFEKFMKTQIKNYRLSNELQPSDYQITDYDHSLSPKTHNSHSEQGKQRQKQNRNLKTLLREKDRKIDQLQQHLIQMKGILNGFKKEKFKESQTPKKNAQLVNHIKPQKTDQQYLPKDGEEVRYQKQINFLTKNNQQLYEQTVSNRAEITKLRKVLKKALQYCKDLENNLGEIQEQNSTLKSTNLKLLRQKETVIKNSEQEIKLFKKMKTVWKSINSSNNERAPESRQLQVSDSCSRKLYKSGIKDQPKSSRNSKPHKNLIY